MGKRAHCHLTHRPGPSRPTSAGSPGELQAAPGSCRPDPGCWSPRRPEAPSDPKEAAGPTCGRGRPVRRVWNKPDAVRDIHPSVAVFLFRLLGPFLGRSIVASSFTAKGEPPTVEHESAE